MDIDGEGLGGEDPNQQLMNLTLDEIVALNKRRMTLASEKSSPVDGGTSADLSLDDIISRSKLATLKSKKPVNFKQAINNKLRNTPGFGSRPIHSRLGYSLNNSLLKRHQFYQTDNKLAQFLAKKSKKFLVGKDYHQGQDLNDFMNSQFTITRPIQNGQFKSPLTRHRMGKFNMTNGFGSVKSFQSKSSFKPFRHNIRNCLTPDIQLIVKGMLDKMENRMSADELDYAFSFCIDHTKLLLDERFSGYY